MKKIQELFESDPERVKMLTKELSSIDGSITIDYSKTHVTKDDIDKWERHLESLKIADKIKSAFSGDRINYTENRRVLHTKLRSQSLIDALGDGAQESPNGTLDKEELEILKEFKSMKTLCELFEKGEMKGASGKRIRNVIGIGIGGSDLGPRLLTVALSSSISGEKTFRYVSNVDAQEMDSATRDLSLEETVFVIVSKTFTTQETLENARIALDRVFKCYPKGIDTKDVVRSHFLAVTAAKDKAGEFGIAPENILDMWDYVGGRYSIWSCVSLTSALAIGFSSFLSMLSGASLMDSHFLNTPVRDNLPMVHAMVECKYFNELGVNNKCVVPYDHYLKLLPFYLQQCEMESNGKSCTKNGKILTENDFSESGVPAKSQTGSIIWGGVGTDVQHSYFQLLHQGTVRVLTEFLFPVHPLVQVQRSSAQSKAVTTSHDVLVSNCLAQSRALMVGKEDAVPEKRFSGDRPSISVMYDRLSPFTLGMLIAMYEHKIFVQGVVWNINSFDQFGVELGKTLAKEILGVLESGEDASIFDSSTSSLLSKYIARRRP